VDNERQRCRDVAILSDPFVDQELPAEVQRRIWPHIRDCVECRTLIEGKAALKRMIRQSAASVLAPAHLRQNLRALIRA
jgi:hypothetical protein